VEYGTLIKQAFQLLQGSLKKLEEVEYAIKLLEEEVKEYRALIDKESYIPKEKFIKQRVRRLIERMKYAVDELLMGVGIKISIAGNIPESDRQSIVNYIATYIDRHIRPSDTLFMLEDDKVGIIFTVKEREHFETIVRRLESMLLNLKAQTYSTKNVLLNYKITSFELDPQMTVEEVFKKLKTFE
jgi:hypothetical protein